MRAFVNKVLPFIIAGVLLALFIALAVLLSYVILWGIAIGIIFWIVAAIKQKFFGHSATAKTTVSKDKQGRIIEHDDKE